MYLYWGTIDSFNSYIDVISLATIKFDSINETAKFNLNGG